MQPESLKCLHDVLEAAKSIESYTRELNEDSFYKNGMAQAATERKFEIIGEALSRIAKLDHSILEGIPDHRRIIGFRNVIAHGYDQIDPGVVWDAIVNHLPALVARVKDLVEDTRGEGSTPG